MYQPKRRQFVVSTIKTAMAVAAFPLPGFSLQANASQPDLVVVRNASPAVLVQKAIDELGGMSRFVQKGQTVLIKPNMSWDRLPELAATTNPDAVAEAVRLCLKAGAGKVRIVDNTCNHARRCYQRSDIERKAVAAGAQVRHIVKSRFVDVPIPDGLELKSWPIYKDALDFDVIINMPIAKTHNVSGVTLGMKNVMGLIGGNRGELHVGFDTKIVDLNTVVRPTLTIIDAYRVLKNNGPSGGSLEDVEEKKTVIAGIDPVAADAYAAGLFGLDPLKLDYLKNANTRGLGEINLNNISAVELNVLTNN